MEFWQLFLHLLGIWCTAGMVVWVSDFISPRPSRTARWSLMLIFSLLALYLFGMAPVFHSYPIRIHVIVPLLAALIYGAFPGIGCALLFGAVQMFFCGWFSYPAEIYMPLVAALLGLLLRLFSRLRRSQRFFFRKVLRPHWGFFAGLFTEALYLFLQFRFYPGETAEALDILWTTAIPTALAGAICIFLGLYVYHDRSWEASAF